MKDNLFIYAVARIRVKEKTLLRDADISQMTALSDEASVRSFLIDKGWGDGSEDGDSDALLTAEETKLRALMNELGMEDEIFEVLSYPVVYHNLKSAIKEICTTEQNEEAFYPDKQYGREAMIKILQDKEYRALPDHMEKAAERAYDTMLTTRDGQMCDVIVDRACLDAMEEAAQHSHYEILRNYEESSVAVANIRIAARACKTNKSEHFLNEALAPCRSINVDALKKAALQGEEELHNYLTSAGFGAAADALRESPSSFERWCDDHQIESLRSQKTNPFTLGPVVAYYLARQNEIKTARIILTAKANGFSEEEIQKRVRKMYG